MSNITKENAAPNDMGNGVNDLAKRDISPANNSPKRGRNAMSLYGKDAHKRTAKIVGYALTLGTADTWHGVAYVLAKCLTQAERASLAYAALQSLDEDTAYMTASVALFGVLNGKVLA